MRSTDGPTKSGHNLRVTPQADLRRIAIYLFLVTSSFGFLQPFLPLFMSAVGLSVKDIGIITGLGSALALVIQPILGRLSDRFDARRPFIVVCALVAAAAYFSLPFARGFMPVLAVVAIGANGVSYLNAVGGVLVGRLVEANRGGTVYASLRVWGSVGYIAVSLITGLLLNFRLGPAGTLNREALLPIFQFGPVLFLVIAGLGFFLPDKKRPPTAPKVAGKSSLSPNLRAFLASYFLYILALYGATSFLSLYLKQLGAKGLMISATFAAGVIVEVLIMRWAGRFSDRFGRRPALAVTYLLLPLRLLLYIPATGPLWVMAVQSLHGINFGIMGAVAVVFVNDLADNDTRGHAQSRLFAVGGLATALGPWLLGEIAGRYGLSMMFGSAAVMAVAAAAIFLFWVEDSHPQSDSLAAQAPPIFRGLLRWLDAPRRR